MDHVGSFDVGDQSEEAGVPALPWMTFEQVDPETECTVMASRLPLRSHTTIPKFLLWTLRIRRQLAHAPGLVGYALDAHLLRKTFWTVSAWTGGRDLGTFNRTEPHRSGTDALRPAMLPATFVVWTARAGDLPIRWDEVRRRIDATSRP
jgi:hypothetical protein